MWTWKCISVRAPENAGCCTTWDCCNGMRLVLQHTHISSKFGYCKEINIRTLLCLLHGFEVLQTHWYYNLIWFSLLKNRQIYDALKFSVVQLHFPTVPVSTTLGLKTLFHIQLSSCCILRTFRTTWLHYSIHGQSPEAKLSLIFYMNNNLVHIVMN